MILPLTHDRMTVQRLPWVTIGILVLNLVVFLATWPRAQSDYDRLEAMREEIEAYLSSHPAALMEDCERCPETAELQWLLAKLNQTQGEHIFSRYGYVPARPRVAGLFGSLFLHAGFWHLLGNMYLLWLCGCSIEDIWGRPLYAAVYLLGGVGASLAHGWFQPESTAHLVGASGAIAALMGAFCVRCWNTNIRFFYWFFVALVGTFTAPAWIMLLLWFFREVFYAFLFAESSTVAFWAHIGGFGFGAAFAFALKLSRLEERMIAPALDRKTNLLEQHPRLASAFEHFDRADYHAAISDLRLALQETGDDADTYQLLARCYQALERPHDAARYLRKELAVHVRGRELDLVSQTYLEIVNTLPDAELTPKELSSAAGALMATGYEPDAVELYTRLLSAEGPYRFRAGIALAGHHHRQGRTRQALSLLDELSSTAGSSPEWIALIEETRQTVAKGHS